MRRNYQQKAKKHTHTLQKILKSITHRHVYLSEAKQEHAERRFV